jgi:enoyl-[acyl-carrier protein] reductase II
MSFPYRTRVCDMLGIEVPIVLAGMGYVSRAELCAAVSEAGGMGVLGAGSMSADALRSEIRRVRSLTKRPFGVDTWQTDPPRAPGQVEVVLEERPALWVVFSPFRDAPPRGVDEARRRGIRVMSLVGTTAEARAHAAAGVDGLIAHGYEGGGHTSDEGIGTFALVPQVVDAVSLPVLAGGGVHDGRGLVAALALGAGGVWVGTRFVNAAEAPIHAGYQRAIQEARDEDTVVTRAYSGLPARVLRNRFTGSWASREADIKPFGEQQRVAGDRVTSGVYQGDRDEGQLPAGQIAGAISDVLPAREIVTRMIEEAREVLATSIYRR